MTLHRWPVRPLLDLGHTHHTIRTATGLKQTTAWRHALDRGLTDWQADRAAIRLGTFPSLVWDGWYETGLDENGRRYLAGGWRQAWLWQQETA